MDTESSPILTEWEADEQKGVKPYDPETDLCLSSSFPSPPPPQVAAFGTNFLEVFYNSKKCSCRAGWDVCRNSKGAGKRCVGASCLKSLQRFLPQNPQKAAPKINGDKFIFVPPPISLARRRWQMPKRMRIRLQGFFNMNLIFLYRSSNSFWMGSEWQCENPVA